MPGLQFLTPILWSAARLALQLLIVKKKRKRRKEGKDGVKQRIRHSSTSDSFLPKVELLVGGPMGNTNIKASMFLTSWRIPGILLHSSRARGSQLQIIFRKPLKAALRYRYPDFSPMSFWFIRYERSGQWVFLILTYGWESLYKCYSYRSQKAKYLNYITELQIHIIPLIWSDSWDKLRGLHSQWNAKGTAMGFANVLDNACDKPTSSFTCLLAGPGLF